MEHPTGTGIYDKVTAHCSRGHGHKIFRRDAFLLVESGTYKWTKDDEVTWRGEPHTVVSRYSDNFRKYD